MKYTIIIVTLFVFVFGASIVQAQGLSQVEVTTTAASGNPKGSIPFQVFKTIDDDEVEWFKTETDSTGEYIFSLPGGTYTFILQWRDNQETKQEKYVGPGMNRFTFRAPAPALPSPPPPVLPSAPKPTICKEDIAGLDIGSRGNRVKTLQVHLFNLGLLGTAEDGNTTGYFGSITDKAVTEATTLGYVKTCNTAVVTSPIPVTPTPVTVIPSSKGGLTASEAEALLTMLREVVAFLEAAMR